MNDHAGGGLGSPEAGFRGGSVGPRRASLPTRVDQLPPLPLAFDRALDAGLAELGLSLPPEALDAIRAHARLLLAWNEAINLTSIVEPDAIARLHVIDSLTALTFLAGEARARRGGAFRLVDIGSGGGYPGLVLAAALPGAEVTLVDSVAKKARFLEAAVEVAGLADRVSVVAERVEALAPRIRSRSMAAFDVVSARAVGSLPDLIELALPILAVHGALVAWKRGNVEPELAAAVRAAAVLGGEIAVHDVAVQGLPGHRLVVVRKLRPTPPGFPRDPGRRRASPW